MSSAAAAPQAYQAARIAGHWWQPETGPCTARAAEGVRLGRGLGFTRLSRPGALLWAPVAGADCGPPQRPLGAPRSSGA